jgi:16S rRNA (guanine966-N2)-methyltransferase
MRVIGGSHKGRSVHPPKGLPVRPTTDFAKEGLFNILNNRIDFEATVALDLFCGTGNISFELASRGCKEVTAVDVNQKCVRFVDSVAKEWQMNIVTVKNDVFRFLKTENRQFDLIFADPPYEMAGIEKIHEAVFEQGLLTENGLLIMEHSARVKLDQLQYYTETRKYGNVNFSFYKKP